jgi:hypothetical protein
MARMIIQLRTDALSGKQNILVKLDSDPDALPIEHEQLHRRLIEQLIGKGLAAEDIGTITIDRETASQPTAADECAPEPAAQPQRNR